jgi:excisionase family DNA binding protein
MDQRSEPQDPASKTSNEIMTVATLAEYLRCHQSTIYRMIKHRQIPAFRIGSDWRFSKAAIEQWLQKSMIWPKPPSLKRRQPAGKSAAEF